MKRWLTLCGLLLVLDLSGAGESGGHWAFQPIRRPIVPEVSGRGWGKNPIDRFLFRRLAAEGLSPSPPAGRRTLIRRAYTDMLGLPPTYQETLSFVHDASEGAFERVVDALLSRKEYGERWARHWLDVARYSDTKGYVDAGERVYPFAYTYRDYVIQALNEDVPYDRFVLEQLAADQLQGREGGRGLAALGFLTVGNRFNFFPHEVLDDRIDVVTRGLMGLTVTCARCHDHKFDPISAADYYGLYGVFSSSREPDPDKLPLLDTDQEGDGAFLKKLEERGAALDKKRLELRDRIQNEMRGWAKDYLVYIVELMPEHRTRAQPPVRTERGALREATAYGRGGVARWRRYIESCGTNDPVFGLWNRVIAVPADEIQVQLQRAFSALRSGGTLNRLLEERVTEAAPKSMVALAALYGELLEETERGARELSEAGGEAVVFPDAAREQLRVVLYGSGGPASVTVEESEDLYQLDEHTEARKHFADVERVYLQAKAGVRDRAMGLVDRPQPVEPHVFVRGDPSRLGPRVPRRLPRLLSEVAEEPFRKGSGRLELAQAIVDPRNPLTARVLVNRVWGWHFGQPLVSTPSDFGTRSTPPSHPELLDYLAGWLQDHNWSMKQLHRLILSSSAYQQESNDRPECREVDPENRLLWRMNRRRLDFEAMRDSMLALTGDLAGDGGGRPAQEALDDPSNRRRTIYGFVDRERLPNLMRVFDFPSPDLSSPGRGSTTVPQQTLFLLNSPFMIARAEALAGQLGEVGSTDLGSSVQRLYRLVYGRDAKEAEVALARLFLQRSQGQELPAWVQYAQVLLQSNEFMFVD